MTSMEFFESDEEAENNDGQKLEHIEEDDPDQSRSTVLDLNPLAMTKSSFKTGKDRDNNLLR